MAVDPRVGFTWEVAKVIYFLVVLLALFRIGDRLKDIVKILRRRED